MVQGIISTLTALIIHVISSLSYFGLVLLMALQTMAVPIPSEVILPFAGFLAFTGRFNLFLIALFGGLGSCVGSTAAYYIGYKGGRPLVEKYGKYILISKHDLDLTDRFFLKFGTWAAFFGQLLPVVRSFIAFPVGVARAPLKKFLSFVFVGSFIWSYALAYVGFRLGADWGTLRDRFKGFDNIVIALIIIGIIFWVYRHLRRGKE